MAANEKEPETEMTINLAATNKKDNDEKNEEENFVKPRRTYEDIEKLLAAAEEEFNLMDSAIDTTVKTLKTGKEIQKLSVIRNFAELLDANSTREEAINRVLPLIQDVLNEEPSVLDIHCEAAIVFKNIIKDKKFSTFRSSLNEKILNYILQNIENQKENVTAAAWLETLAEISEFIPVQSVIDLLVPVAICQSESTRRVQRRVIAAKLIEKLCTILPAEIVRRELTTSIQMLCKDPSITVRTTISQRLAVIAQAFNNSAECSSLLLQSLINLCKDDDSGVREAILNTIIHCLPYFNKESLKTIVVPLLRRSTDQALLLRDVTLSVVAKQLGCWLESLCEIISLAEKNWFLETYCRIANLSWNDNNNNNNNCSSGNINLTTTNSIIDDEKNLINKSCSTNDSAITTSTSLLYLTCKRMCAYNFPCFAMHYGKENFNERLMPILERFCKDNDDEVRSIMASGFHEIVQLLQEQSKNQNFIGPFFELMCSGNAEVVQHMAANLHKTLPILYKKIRNCECFNNNFSSQKFNIQKSNIITNVHLDRILIGCNTLIRSSGSWRSHEAYLKNLSVLRHCISVTDLLISFVPMLNNEILTARALPCRIAAAHTLLLFMREFPMEKNRRIVIDFFTKSIAEHKSCHRRRLLLDIVPIILENFSREFFIKYFLPAILNMSKDGVSNIRLQMCKSFILIKKYLLFPNDDESLSSMENVIRELLITEQNVNTRQLIQQYACQLSRMENDLNVNRINKTKLNEEKILWTEIEPPEILKINNNNNNNNKTVDDSVLLMNEKIIRPVRKSVTESILMDKPPTNLQTKNNEPKPPSGWRTSRRSSRPPQLAIVRPQPQIVIVQRSPSPMPTNKNSTYSKIETEKKSRLPLSTARYRSSSTATSPTTTTFSTSLTDTIKNSEKKTSKLKKYKTNTDLINSDSLTNKNDSKNSSIYTPTNTTNGLRRSSLNYDNMSKSTTTTSSLIHASSESSIRRPYGLMRVQSTSAVERKPTQMSIKVISMS